jgi:acyl-CoA reductase-like NAD-dependent aldehyde dehydrogenase
MPSQDSAAAIAGGGRSRNTDTDAAAAARADRRLLIDGRLVTADRVFPSANPAIGEIVGHAPDAGVAEDEAAMAAARRAFDTTSWPTDVDLRVRCLDQLHQALLDHADELRELTIAEVGATRALTHSAQLDEPIGIVRYYADLLRTYLMAEELGEIESRALAVARRIRSGSFSINGGNYFAADCPFGGFKQSGIGREMGVAGLEEFLERKTFAVPVVPVSGVA